MALVIFRSKIHNSGCYTTAPIKKGSRVAEYTGPRITIRRANQLYETSRRTYLFGLTNGKQVIDGDGVAAFINHSCSPNCEVDEIRGHVWILALRNIRAGEELHYDYSLYDGDPGDKALCCCGARNCRGTMYSEDEIERRSKLRKRAQNKIKTTKKRRKPLTPALAAAKRQAGERRNKTRLLYTVDQLPVRRREKS
jgi:uncharacterized protein